MKNSNSGKSTKSKKIFVGVSWPYANGSLHLGHLAGQNIVADIFSRYHRLKGNQVLEVSGSDCHGAPVSIKAEEKGISPEQFAAESHQEILNIWEKLGLVWENYTKTSTENHKVVAQNIFTVLVEKGYLVKQNAVQYYDEKVNQFLPDRYVKGTCPKCGAGNARGDECPECSAFLEPKDLINPYSTLSDSTPVMRDTEHYYLDLRTLSDKIETWVNANSGPWRKWVKEFSLGWIKQGLDPRPITRDIKYGIPVPLEGWEDNKVLYVWFEAVIGYLSASIEWAEKIGEPSKWEEFWKNPDAKHYYFIAGGNTPFHTIIWPAELLAYNEKYGTSGEIPNKLPGESLNTPLNLPYDVPSNNMLFYNGKKVSKGDGTELTIWSTLEKYSPDQLRFFFARMAPEKQDRDYSEDDLKSVASSELVGNLGNFINRTLTFTYNNFDGKVPSGVLDPEINERINDAFIKIGESIETCNFVNSTKELLEFGDYANKYFNDTKVWEVIKTDKEKAADIIYNAIQLANAIRLLLRPYTPFAVETFNETFNVSASEIDPNSSLSDFGNIETPENSWFFNEIEAGHELNQPFPVFGKVE